MKIQGITQQGKEIASYRAIWYGRMSWSLSTKRLQPYKNNRVASEAGEHISCTRIGLPEEDQATTTLAVNGAIGTGAAARQPKTIDARTFMTFRKT